MFKCQVTGLVSKPRQPQVRLILSEREAFYENIDPETEERKITRGSEIVREAVTYDPNWAELPTAVKARQCRYPDSGVPLAEHLAEKGADLLTTGNVVVSSAAPGGCIATKRQLERQFRGMAHFAKMVEMSRDYLKANPPAPATYRSKAEERRAEALRRKSSGPASA